MKKVYRIWALLLMSAILFSCAKETLVDNTDAIAGGTTTAITDGGSDNGDGNDGSGSGNGENGSENDGSGEDSTPADKPEFVDNNDWSAYDENEYLIGFGAVDENSVEGSKLGIDFDARQNLTWEGGEEVTVYVPATNKSGTYFYDKTREQFRPNSPEDILAVGDNLAYVYYPADLFKSFDRSTGKATVTMPSAVTANTLASLAAKLPMSGIIPSEQGKAYPTVTFRNLCSVMRVRLTGCETVKSVRLSNSNIALTGDGLVIWDKDASDAIPSLVTSGGSTSMTISCGAGGITLDEDTETEFYFLLPPSAATMNAMTVTVTFSQKDDDNYTYEPYITKTRSDNMTLARNKVIKLAFRAGFFSGGKGTSDAPYQISTPAQLNQLGQYCRQTDAYKGYNETAGRTYFSTAHYVQTANLNCSGVSISGPIGSVTWPFYGSYDGDGYTISNYSLSTNGSYQVALFGKVHGGTIEGVRLQSASISSSNTESSTINVAGVVGYLSGGGTVDDCQSISTSVQGLKTGGVVGYVENGTVSDCQSRGVTVHSQGTYLVDGVVTYGYAGGVVGGTKDGTISGCRCWGANADGTGTASSISGGGVAGGIAGYIGGASGTTAVTDAYVTNASITTTGNYAGGAIGNIYGGGSLTGRTGDGGSSLTVKDASVTAANYAGGLVGRNTGTITGTKYNSNKNYTALTHRVTVNATNYAGGLCGINENAGMLDCCYANRNTVTASHAYAGGLCGTATGTQTLTDCLARGSTIKAFDGDSTYGDYVGGLFGYLGASTGLDCSDLTADNGYNNTIDGNGYVGGVCGYQLGPVTGHASYPMCAKSTITARSEYLGGISGCCEGNITNCVVGKSDNVNALSGTSTIGGIAGEAAAGLTISGCSVSNTTFSSSASNSITGGLLGRISNAVTISGSSINTLSFTSGGGYYGGLVASVKGASASATISACSVTGLTVTGADNYVGGAVGYIYTSCNLDISGTPCSTLSFSGGSGYTGGVVGFVKGTVTIDDCDVTGLSISSYTSNCVGGVLGRVGDSDKVGTAIVKNCEAKGSINVHNATSSTQGTGGIVGFAYNSATFTVFKCINSVAVTGDQYVGGIVGRMLDGDVHQCVNKASITGTSERVGGIVGWMTGGTVRVCYSSNNGGKVITGLYSVGGLVGFMESSESRALIINCAARTTVSSTGGNDYSNCATGGLVGYMRASASYDAFLLNSVAFDKVIQNTNASAMQNIGGVVGFVTTKDDAAANKCIIRNCYAQIYEDNLLYMNAGTKCPSGSCYGGIMGRLNKGYVQQCYYRCAQGGQTDTGGDITKLYKISDAAKNGTANVNVAVTLVNRRSFNANTKKLYEILTEGSFSGESGSTAQTVSMSKGGSTSYSTWGTYKTSENLFFAVPQVLLNLKEEYYLN